MKTISERLREHALGRNGKFNFWWINDPSVHQALYSFIGDDESCTYLSEDEKRMFCLFVSEALENQ